MDGWMDGTEPAQKMKNNKKLTLKKSNEQLRLELAWVTCSNVFFFKIEQRMIHSNCYFFFGQEIKRRSKRTYGNQMIFWYTKGVFISPFDIWSMHTGQPQKDNTSSASFLLVGWSTQVAVTLLSEFYSKISLVTWLRLSITWGCHIVSHRTAVLEPKPKTSQSLYLLSGTAENRTICSSPKVWLNFLTDPEIETRIQTSVCATHEHWAFIKKEDQKNCKAAMSYIFPFRLQSTVYCPIQAQLSRVAVVFLNKGKTSSKT